MNNPTISLAIMVKNEEKVIIRCLSSVKDIVDYIFVVDTGSTDNTIEVVKNYLVQNNLKGEVVERPWKNFGTNKTEAISLAKSKADYTLWMDADDVIVNQGFDKSILKTDSYYLRYTGANDYANLRILSNKFNWTAVGVIHTYLETSKPIKTDSIETLKIKTFNDGAIERDDVKILIEALKTEPNNSRYMFYLAQSYKDRCEYQNAIDCYHKRITMKGFVEEVFYSKYMIAYCFECLGKIREAKLCYLNAWEDRPNRAEPLYHLAALCRLNKEYQQGYLFIKKALEIPYPTDLLFIEKNNYKYFLLFELSINAYWIGRYSESLECCLKLEKMNDLPEQIKFQNQKNIEYNKQKLNMEKK